MDRRKLIAVLLCVATVASTAVVVAENEGPMADAGLDRSVDLGETVYLDGTGSRAETGRIVDYRWYVSPPGGERRRLADGNEATCAYVPESVGEYRFTLEVTGSNGKTSEDYVVVRVETSETPTEDSNSSNKDDKESDNKTETSEDKSDSNPVNDTKRNSEKNTETSDTPETTEKSANESGNSTSRELDLNLTGPTVVISNNSYEYEVNSNQDYVQYTWYKNTRLIGKGDDPKANVHFDGSLQEGFVKVNAVTEHGQESTDSLKFEVKEANSAENNIKTEPDHQINNINAEIRYAGDAPKVQVFEPLDRKIEQALSTAILQESVHFSADIESTNELDLTYSWDFGDGSKTRTSRPSVDHFYAISEPKTAKFELELKVTDQYGRSTTQKKTVYVQGPTVSNEGHSVEIIDKDTSSLTATFKIETTSKPTEKEELYEFYFGDGQSINLYSEGCYVREICDGETYTISHKYDSPGTYTAWVSGKEFKDTSSETSKTFSFDSYTEYHYTERTTAVAEHVAEESPGEGWKRVGIDSIQREVIDRKRTRIREDHRPDALLSDDWRRIGTETETETRRETRVAAQRPGPEWSLAESSVDTETRQVGYDRMELPHRGLAPDDATLVGTTRDYHTTTERERSTSRPSGSGWSRVRSTGQVRDGTGTTWRSSRYAPPGWRRIDSRTETNYYPETETYCKQRTNSWFGEGHCIEWGERTVWRSETTTEYEYAYPTYSTEYLWERTVTTSEVNYEYRVPTYDEVDLHRWERTYDEQIEYGVYEKREYETNTTYEWQKTVEREVDRVSLTPPNTDEIEVIGEVTEHVHACGSGEGELEEEACS